SSFARRTARPPRPREFGPAAPTIRSGHAREPQMQPSVESLCNLLAKHRLVPPDQIRSLRQNWLRQAPNPLDVEAFAKWVVAQKAITEHQLGVLLRGNADSLFLDRYTIQERVGRGRFAGVW